MVRLKNQPIHLCGQQKSLRAHRFGHIMFKPSWGHVLFKSRDKMDLDGWDFAYAAEAAKPQGAGPAACGTA